MAQILLKLDDDLKVMFQEKARKSNRSMTAHLIHLIQRDLEGVKIPIIGKIQNGVITIDEELARR
jgi:hypothetical protein